MSEKAHRSITLWDVIKNIFLLLFVLQITPPMILSIKKQYARLFELRTPVAVLPIKGALYDSTRYVRQLNTFFKDSSVKAVLLKIESPGSSAGTGQALYHEIMTLKKQYPKPVIVLIENVCASGGYYIASAADYIIASGAATVGSIGTYLPQVRLKEFIEQFKVHYNPIKSGEYKTVTDPFTDKTAAEQELLQGLASDIYDQFITDIATSRKLAITESHAWANGKIFTARQAQKLGLIDELGTASTAERVIKEKALIEGEIEWIYPPKQGGLASILIDNEDNDDTLFESYAHRLLTVIEKRYGVLSSL